jgi:hypothetical protein
VKLNFFVKTTLAVGGIFGAGILAMMFLGSGEKAEVEAALLRGQEALNRHDAEFCASMIYPRYSHRGADFDEVVTKIRQYVVPSYYQSVEFHDVEVEAVGETAGVRVRMVFKGGTADLMPYAAAKPFRFSLRKVDGRWLIDAIDPPEPYR